MTAMFGSVPETIIGGAGLSSGMRSAITPTTAAAALYEHNSIFGHFGPGAGRRPASHSLEAVRPHAPVSHPASGADNRDAAGHLHSDLSGRLSNAPHNPAKEVTRDPAIDLLKEQNALLRQILARSSAGSGPMSPQGAVRASEQHQATTGRY